MDKDFTTITVPRELKDLLESLQQPGQSLRGIIQQLCNEHIDQHEPLIKKLSELYNKIDRLEGKEG